ncbi:MAG: 30S ribosomal protein S20 [Alphaproteobacteria bacterium]
MAHTRQQQKRVRQDIAINATNTTKRSAIRTAVKAFETALTAGDKTAIEASFKNAMSMLASGARKGIVTKGAAARKTSRLAARLPGAKAKA